MPAAAPTSAAATLASSDFERTATLPANFLFQNPYLSKPLQTAIPGAGERIENSLTLKYSSLQHRKTAQLDVRKILRGTLQWGEAREGTFGP